MRLYTEISSEGPGDCLVMGDADAGLSIDYQLEHDAAAAHALLQVIDDCTDKVFSKYAAGMMKERAAKLMAEWGFTEQAGGE